MSRKIIPAALLILLPLAALPAACGKSQDEKSALKSDELDRDLNLALQKDSTPATFEDTALTGTEAAPPPAATPPRPEPRPQPPVRREPAPRRTPTPAPQTRSTAPTPQPAPAPAPATASVGTGTSMAVLLDQTLSTQTNNPGDAFTAHLSQPVLAGDGSVLIPAGAVVHGRVTGVDKSNHVGQMAVMKIAFESISFDGHTYPLQATVTEANPQRHTRQSTAQQAGKVAVGAAAGAILGKVLGHSTGSTVKGAVIGAAAGTAIAMGTADVDAVLPQGSRVVIRTDEPIEVARR